MPSPHLRIPRRSWRPEANCRETEFMYIDRYAESPHAEPPGQQLTPHVASRYEEQSAAQEVKETKVLVCMGNRPYDRTGYKAPEAEEKEQRKRRRGTLGEDGKEGILEDFLKPVRDAGQESTPKTFTTIMFISAMGSVEGFRDGSPRAVSSFITASSYLQRPASSVCGKRCAGYLTNSGLLIQKGDNRGARVKTQNVFNIQTPVTIAIGVRYGKPNNRNRPKSIIQK